MIRYYLFSNNLILTSLILAGSLCQVLYEAPRATAQSRPAFLHDDIQYAWPTNASYYMSSSFGETRASHFHAAMDIGTWGHEGYAVFAARDGILERIGVGPAGYGNVIYLRHDDGTISLYAHLKDFHPRIRSVVDSLRMTDYRFEFDRNMEEFDIRFRRGQQIGWTGSTGVGPPHLHFELRTPGGRPFNPLLAGLQIDDTIPPQFSELAIEPLSADSKINGRTGIYRTRPSRSGGAYHFGTVDVTGEVGLAVDVFDRANASNNVHAVYELQLYVNDERHFHSRVDSFAYSETRQMFLDRVFSILEKERKGLQRLYVREGNTLSFYQDTGHNGRLNLPSGTHDLRIEASDFFGNQSKAYLRLRVSESDGEPVVRMNTPPGYRTPPEVSASARNPDSPGTVPDHLDWHKNWVRPAGPEQPAADNPGTRRLTIRPLGSFADEAIHYSTTDHGIPLSIATRKELLHGGKSWTLYRISPDHPVSIYHENMRMSLYFPADAFYEPVSIGVAGSYPGITIFPDIEPFRRPATLRILLDEKLRDKPGLALYRIHPRTGDLRYVSSYRDPDKNILVGSLPAAGVYTVRADSVGPEIKDPEIGMWRHNRQYYITVSVEDDKSGIDHESAKFIVNGKRGIAEYDPEKQLLRYHRPGFTPREENDIKVRLSDRAGNTTEKTFTGLAGN